MQSKRKELYERVNALMKWDDEKTEYWFKTDNPNLGGVSPDDMIFRGRELKLEQFIANAEYENGDPNES